MGKHSAKGHNRVVFVCMECAYLAGKVDAQYHGTKLYNSSCDICRRKKVVTEARDWNFFTPDQVAQAKAKLRELGLDRRTFANVSDVKSLMAVTQDVLKEHQSAATREVIRQITDMLAKGQPIEMYYAKQLTYCFTQDAARLKAQRDIDKAKKKRRGKGSGLIQKAPGLVMVQGGKEIEVEHDEDV